MGPAESYFGRASLPVALVRRCDLSHSVSSCSLHEVLEVVHPCIAIGSQRGWLGVRSLFMGGGYGVPTFRFGYFELVVFRIFRFMISTLCLTSPR